MNLEALDRAMNICSSARGIYSVKCSSKFPDIYYIN